MEVTSCKKCPFRVSIFNSWSIGYDTSDICALEANKNLIEIHDPPTSGIIRQYNESEDQELNYDYDIPFPNWCPLKSVENLEISLITT